MIKKEKIFELRIDEEDDLSGIDSISLVDEPAIEVNWVAFKKAKPEDFHIPDGEDDKYLQMLIEKGQNEQDLLDEGFKPVSITEVGKDEFISAPNPNELSGDDTMLYRVRYRYGLSPNIKENPVISTTRQFCKELINKNYVFRVEDIEATFNEFGQTAQTWRGGYNCRHRWFKILYRKEGDIINKASVNKNKVTTETGIGINMTPDFVQPSTVTNKTLANPKPSTIKNLGLSKEDFNGMDIFGFKPRYFHMCPGAQSLFEHLIEMPMDEETVGMVRSAAQIADNVFRIEEEAIKAEESSIEQLSEAVVLVDDFKDVMAEIDEEVGMVHDVSFMDGHIVKIKELLKEDMEYDVSTIVGYVDPGFEPKKKKKKEFESYSDYPESVKNNAKAVLKWVEENGWGSCGTPVGKQRANQLANGEPISFETIKRMYSYLSRHEKDLESSKGYGDGCGKLMYDSWGGKTALSWAESKINSIERENMYKQYFQTDDEKQIVLGPAMIPNLRIFRKDKQGSPYYVYFTEDTIKMIAEKYMKNKYIDNNDENHNGRAVQDVYVIESWIKEDENDKSNKYGFESLPIGTWFVAMKVRNPEIWKKVKNKELNGFSVSGFFEEVSKFTKEEMFLYKVAEILKKIKD